MTLKGPTHFRYYFFGRGDGGQFPKGELKLACLLVVYFVRPMVASGGKELISLLVNEFYSIEAI